MIFVFVFTVCVGLLAMALTRLEDSHDRVIRLLKELDGDAVQQAPAEQAQTVPPSADASQQFSFTRSLLALSKVDSLVPCDSPALFHGGSSLSASTRRDQ